MIDAPLVGPADVLIRVRAAGLCETDVFFYSHADELASFGIPMPLTMGHEVAGEVVEVGREVTVLRPGDRVVVEPNVTCGTCLPCRSGRPDVCAKLVGIGQTRDGGFAEYLSAPAGFVHQLPSSVTYEVGALAEPVACALHGFRRTRLRSGEDVLLIGDGFFGLVFAQVARVLGARRIVILGHHENRLAIARAEGADFALDERSPEAEEMLSSLGDGLGPHVVIDTVGSSTSLPLAIKSVMAGGRVGVFGVSSSEVTLNPVMLMLKAPDIVGLVGNPVVWPEVLRLLETGAINPATLVSHVLPLVDLPRAFALKSSRAPEVLKIVVTSGG